MGCYVNPAKEEFLEEHSIEFFDWYDVPHIDFKSLVEKDRVFPVVLLDNGNFMTAGVAFNEDEYNRFMDPRDERPKRVFLMLEDTVKRYSDLEIWLK